MTKKSAENKLTARPHVRKFSPGIHQSDEEIIEQFVVRDHELGIVLEVLRENILSPSCQHVLIVAPRGRGKTMLLARTAAELRTNDKFSEFLLPVQFMEESQEIFNLADFWLETLFHLARETATHDPELSQELRETHAALTDRWHESELGDHARSAVLMAADRLDRKLVLMVENLQALCESVNEDFGWKLREVLQSEPKIILIASSTSRFESLDDVEQPFFELFRIINLERLTIEDCRRLWEVVSGRETSSREVRPLEILTGGSPRLLVIVAGFARHGSIRQLMEELVKLIDEHTEYFRSHLEGLPRMERRVYLAVIDLWQPSKPSEIATRARMDIRNVSTMLGRLINRGAVIWEGSGKKRLYVATERLYSIYYKLRRERDEAVVVQNLIYFMAVFYSESELYEISENLIAEAAQSKTIREGIERAITERSQIEDESPNIKWQTIRQISNQALENYRLMNEQFIEKEIGMALKEKDPKKIIEIVNKALPSQNIGSFTISESRIAFLLNKKIRGHEQMGDFEAVITTCDEVIKHFTDAPDMQWHVAWAMTHKGDTLGKLNDFQAAITAYDKVIERFADAPDLQQHVAWAMTHKGDVLGKLNDFQAAITAYDRVIERFADTPDLQQHVAWAMTHKGDALGKLNDFQAAITAYDRVIERFADASDLQERVAFAMIDKGDVLGKLNDFQAAITAYDRVIERFADTPDMQWHVAWAITHKGKALEKLNDFQAAITAYDRVIERFADTPDLQGPIAWTMVDKGKALEKLNDSEAAIITYDEMIEYFADAPDMQRQVAWAMIFKADALGGLGNFETMITVCDKVIQRFSDALDLQWHVAWAMTRKGVALGKLNDFQAAITAYDRVIERFADTPDLQYQVASATIDKAELQIKIHRSEDALHTCGNFEQKIGVLDSDENTEFAWRAMCVRALALMAQKKHCETMDVFRLIYDKFMPNNEMMILKILNLVQDMIAIGFPMQGLVNILSSNEKKSAALRPLIVALCQHSGESVHAPLEVLEVAADIRKQFEEKMSKHIADYS